MTKRLFKCISSTEYFRIGKVYECVGGELNGTLFLATEEYGNLYVFAKHFKELSQNQVYQREYHKGYRERSRELLNSRSHDYAQSHREELREKSKEYRANNREQLRQYELSRWPKRKEQRRLQREALKLEKQNLPSHE